MKTDVCLLSAAVGAAGVIIASAAIPAELPREGAFDAAVILKGRPLQSNAVGKTSEAEFGAWEGGGPWSVTGPFPPIREHVLALYQIMNGMIESHSYNIDTDSDGDQIVWKGGPEPRLRSVPTEHGTLQAIYGTGKYAGISGTNKYICEHTQSASGETVSCRGQITYKLP
ncbi:MAG TPA: hypothetical protein VMI72_13555 [Roseiarcus sp.]|nr:hypothetical protein [Roseiarcus sp.]